MPLDQHIDLPEGVERYEPIVTGGPAPGAPRYAPNTVEMRLREYDGEWIKYSDLPAILDHARQQERERLLTVEAIEAAQKPAGLQHRKAEETIEAALAALDDQKGDG